VDSAKTRSADSKLATTTVPLWSRPYIKGYVPLGSLAAKTRTDLASKHTNENWPRSLGNAFVPNVLYM